MVEAYGAELSGRRRCQSAGRSPARAAIASMSYARASADQPVPTKGVAANAQPLRKSGEEGFEDLNKSEVASKLFELKKSGTKVDSLDITRAEMGQDLAKIVAKYKIS